MLLDLPRACLENVYDMLHVQDRIRLNSVLPRDQRVVKSLRTNEKKDRMLALANVACKRIKKDKITGKLTHFLSQNRDDPTVIAIVADHGVVLPDIECEIEIAATLCDLKKGQVVTKIPLEMSNNDVLMAVRIILSQGTPKQFDALAHDPRVHEYLCADDVLFRTINHGNMKLCSHIMAKCEALVGINIPECINYMTVGHGKHILTMPHTRANILQIIPLTTEHRQVVENAMLQDLDIEAWTNRAV